MNQLNSDFLERIALSFGDNTQFSSPPLIEGLLPNVDAEPYRQSYVIFRDTAAPTGGAGEINFTYQAPALQAMEVIAGDLAVAVGSADALIKMQSSFGTQGVGTEIVLAGQAVVMKGERQAVCGQLAIDSALGANEQRPARIFVPAGEFFQIIISVAGGGAFPVAQNLDWHFVARTIPQPRAILRQLRTVGVVP